MKALERFQELCRKEAIGTATNEELWKLARYDALRFKHSTPRAQMVSDYKIKQLSRRFNEAIRRSAQ